MLSSTLVCRGLRLSAMFAALTLATACDDDDPVEPDDPAENVESMRLTVGGSTYTVTSNGVLTPSPISVPIGSVAVEAEFLDANGEVVDGLIDEPFEFRAEPANTSILTFERTGAFEGTFTGLQPGQTTVAVSLYHVEENHPDFGPFEAIPVTVGP